MLFPRTQPPPKLKPALRTRPAAGSTNQEQKQKRSSLPRPPDTPVIEIRSDNNKWAITGTRASLGEGSEPVHSPASPRSLARPMRAGAVRASSLNGRERRAPARTPRQPPAAGIFIRLATCLSAKNRFLLPGWKAALMSAGQPRSPPLRLSARRGGRLGAPRAMPPRSPSPACSCLLLIALLIIISRSGLGFRLGMAESWSWFPCRSGPPDGQVAAGKGTILAPKQLSAARQPALTFRPPFQAQNL